MATAKTSTTTTSGSKWAKLLKGQSKSWASAVEEVAQQPMYTQLPNSTYIFGLHGAGIKENEQSKNLSAYMSWVVLEGDQEGNIHYENFNLQPTDSGESYGLNNLARRIRSLGMDLSDWLPLETKLEPGLEELATSRIVIKAALVSKKSENGNEYQNMYVRRVEEDYEWPDGIGEATNAEDTEDEEDEEEEAPPAKKDKAPAKTASKNKVEPEPEDEDEEESEDEEEEEEEEEEEDNDDELPIEIGTKVRFKKAIDVKTKKPISWTKLQIQPVKKLNETGVNADTVEVRIGADTYRIKVDDLEVVA